MVVESSGCTSDFSVLAYNKFKMTLDSGTKGDSYSLVGYSGPQCLWALCGVEQIGEAYSNVTQLANCRSTMLTGSGIHQLCITRRVVYSGIERRKAWSVSAG